MSEAKTTLHFTGEKRVDLGDIEVVLQNFSLKVHNENSAPPTINIYFSTRQIPDNVKKHNGFDNLEENIEEYRKNKKTKKEMEFEFHAFISHASEDKEGLVRPLYQELKEKGFNLWFDEMEIELGDSFRRKIDEGLVKSMFGIIVFSPEFLVKDWTQYELDGLLGLEFSNGKKRILPIWHRVTKEEILKHAPSYYGKKALRTSDMSVGEIVNELSKYLTKYAQ